MMKAMLKMSAAILEPAEQRRDGEQDRDRAAQADPGDEGDLRARQAERDQAEPDRDRPGDEDQEQAERDRRQQDRRELRRRGEQAEHQEHDDLRQPRHAVLEALQDGDGADVGIAGDQAGEIDGEEARAADGAGGGEDHQRQGQHEDRQQAMVEIEPVDEAHDGEAAEHADDRAEAHVEEEAEDEVGDQHIGFRVGAGRR